MMYSYHSLPDLQKAILENELETSHVLETHTPQIRDYICCKDARYIFYILFMIMLILFLIFIAYLITIYTSK